MRHHAHQPMLVIFDHDVADALPVHQHRDELHQFLLVLGEKLGGHVVGIGVLIELTFLKGREKFADYDIFSLIEF